MHNVACAWPSGCIGLYAECAREQRYLTYNMLLFHVTLFMTVWAKVIVDELYVMYLCSRIRPSATCMQDTFARATHSAGRPRRDDRVPCIQINIQLITLKIR